MNDELPKSSASEGTGVEADGRASPLSAQQYAEIQMAQQRAKKIHRAMGVARLDAWFSGAFAAITLLSALLSPWSLLLGAALAMVAFNSFRGARLLRQFDARAPGMLAWNQVLLALVIIIYALFSLWDARRGSSELLGAVSSDPALLQMLGDLKPMLWELSVAIYGTLIVATVVTQGLTGLYYRTREKYITAYHRDTPPWVLELQRKQAGG